MSDEEKPPAALRHPNQFRQATAKLRGKSSKDEWSFDAASVPDKELVACCYWEYARESAFIREVIQDFKNVGQGKGSTKNLKDANVAMTRLYSIGTPVDLLLKLPFPAPWQSLEPSQRETGQEFTQKIPTPVEFPAFRVCSDYSPVHFLFDQIRQSHSAEMAAWRRLAEIDRGVAGLKEAGELRRQLAEQAQHPPPVILRGAGGVDSFVGQVNWREFTNAEIAKAFLVWLEKNEPKNIQRPRRRGHKPRDWRASLERLGMMRLMHRHRFEAASEIVQTDLAPKAADRDKYSSKAEWKKERQKAIEDFHELFPFLEKDDPVSCAPLVGRW